MKTRTKIALVCIVGLVALAAWQRARWRPLAGQAYRKLKKVTAEYRRPSYPAHPPGVNVDVAMTIRCDLPKHPISPLVYGIGFAASHPWELRATARRWGGNPASRYNWEAGHAWNAGKDWFFRNVDYVPEPGPAYASFIEDDLAHGMQTALTVPLIGWVSKDTTSYSFPVDVFGPQQLVAPEDPNMGNGVAPDGGLIRPGPPDRTSVPLEPEGVTRWVRAIRAADAKRGSRGVQMYILDNEPTLWDETHRDVHPDPVSYDELLDRSVRYAAAIRAGDPDAVIAGPAAWGWLAYLYSGIDIKDRSHPDQKKHDGVPLLPWWLREMAAREKATGTRLLDVVDVHYYPSVENMGIATSGATDPVTAARRIRSTRSFWDPDYEEESWVGEKVRLIPRLKEWIAENHPGLGISIGEYNFGAEGDMSGGLALAEALGRFGEQGILSAFYWDAPAKDSPAAWAFRAYRDFDGRGGRFLDESVPATSSDRQASIFASRDGDHMVAVILNLDPGAPMTAKIDASSCGTIGAMRTLSYAGGPSGFEPKPGGAVSGGTLTQPLAPYSMTIVDFKRGP
jgi:hypothetical protein